MDYANFDLFAKDTAQLCISLLILMHGTKVVTSFMLLIGQLSEEAMKAGNKYFKSFDKHHTRKISKEQNNQDLIRFFLVSSDPFISSHLLFCQKRSDPIPLGVRNLLASPK